jgi:hypothetical protein
MASNARLLPAAALVWLPLTGCVSPPATYQTARSENGRCVCQITEYDDPKWDAGCRLLDLQIDLDGNPVLRRSYLGSKRWGGKSVRFSVVNEGRYYYVSVLGYPAYAVAAIDTEKRSGSNQPTRQAWPSREHSMPLRGCRS